MHRLIINLLCVAMVWAASAQAQRSADIPESEGPIPVNQVPGYVHAVAKERCPGFLIDEAAFKWLTDNGTFIMRGRCDGERVKIRVTGAGKLHHFQAIED